jgi:hypothetical protein
MSRVQSPVISTALRRALDLAGSGAFPLDVEGGIVPVVLVGDVTQEVGGSSYEDYSQNISIAGVAAQYGRAQLRWVVNQGRSVPTRVDVRFITISAYAATRALIGYPGLIPANGLFGKSKSQSAANQSVGSCQIEYDTNAAAPNASGFQYSHNFPAASFERLDFSDSPWTLSGPNGTAGTPSLLVHLATVNIGVDVTFEWREYYSPVR